MLVRKDQTVKLESPFEEGSWVTIRALTGDEMDEAKDASTQKTMKQFEGSIETFLNMDITRAENAAKAVRKGAYDPAVLLGYAIVAWSEPDPVTPENIALLDGQTRDWLWQEVVDRNTRPPM